jgi:hypothetical protein
MLSTLARTSFCGVRPERSESTNSASEPAMPSGPDARAMPVSPGSATTVASPSQEAAPRSPYTAHSALNEVWRPGVHRLPA